MKPRKKPFFALFGLLSSAALQPVAFAEEADTTAVAAMGGAGVANTFDNNALVRSTAALVLEESYTGQVDFGFARGWRGQASLVDTRSGQIGAGVSYTRHHYTPELSSTDMPGWVLPDQEITNRTVAESWRLGAGLADRDRLKSLGVSVVWDRTNEELRGRSNSMDLDASFAARIGSLVTISGTAHNVLPEPDAAAEGSELTWGDRPLSAELGAWVTASERLGFAGDGVMTGDGEFGGRFGLQGATSDSLLLRAGGSWIGGDWAAAAGFGAYSETSALNYAIQYDIAAGEFWHTVGLNVLF